MSGRFQKLTTTLFFAADMLRPNDLICGLLDLSLVYCAEARGQLTRAHDFLSQHLQLCEERTPLTGVEFGFTEM